MSNLRAMGAQPAPRSSLPEQIRVAIESDRRIERGPTPIGVEVRDGRVVLSGWVPRVRDKKRIENIARDFAPGYILESSLLVGPPRQRSDAEIVQHVQNSFMEDRWINAPMIQVQAHDGVVFLSGTVQTTMQWRFVRGLCWWIPGVRDVHDDLRVLHPEPVNDELLAEAVILMLEKDPLVDRTEILVLAKDNIITLSGTVGGEDARDAAENDAWVTTDVRDVVNQIEVVSIPGAPPIRGLDD